MKPNQFNPSPEELAAIKLKNSQLPQLERICYKCGHLPCGGCVTWCDTYLMDLDWSGNWEGYEGDEDFLPHVCCDGECSYL